MKRYGWRAWTLSLCLVLACDQGRAPGVNPGDADAGTPDAGATATATNTPHRYGAIPAGKIPYRPPAPPSPDIGALSPILRAVCEKRITCCNGPGEREWTLGAPIKSVEDCVSVAASLLENFSDPKFLELPVPLLEIMLDLADPPLRVSLREEGVVACAQQIRDGACPSASSASGRCDLPTSLPKDACALANLVTGLGEKGDPCIPKDKVNTCGENLTCRRVGPEPPEICGPCDPVICIRCPPENPRMVPGVCSPTAKEGDACKRDTDCDALFCDPSSGQCAARRKLGEPCAYQDENLTSLTTAQDCEAPLVCDPLRRICVPSCGEGALCNTNAECAAGLFCDLAALRNVGSSPYRVQVGLCGPALADGAVCAETKAEDAFGFSLHESACVSGGCNTDSTGSGQCGAPPAPYNGPTCLVHQQNDLTNEVLVDCPSGTVCHFQGSLVAATEKWYPRYARLRCVQPAGLNQWCVNGKTEGCQSGLYCGRDGTCLARNQAPGGPCEDNVWNQCQEGERCALPALLSDPAACAPYRAMGEPCRSDSDSSCGPQALCFEGQCARRLDLGAACRWNGVPCEKGTFCNAPVRGSGTCEPLRGLGAPCDPSVSQCEPPRVCALRDGEYRCGTAPSDSLCDGIP